MSNLKLSDKTKNEIIERYYKDEKATYLCEEFGISKSYFYKIIKQNKKYYNDKGRLTPIEIYKMQRKFEAIKTENEIFKKSKCGINSSINDKIEAIEKLKDKYSVHTICKTLGLLKSTYYHRVNRAPEQKWYESRNEILKPLILEIFKQSKERFGAGKILVKLKQDKVQASLRLISRLMKEMGLVCMQNRLRMHNTTNKSAKYRKNRLRRDFSQDTPNTYWVSDITYMLTKEGDCYICVIIDLFFRKVVAHEVSKKIDTELTLSTFKKAYFSRGNPTNLLFHSDQGSQYISSKFKSFLRANKVAQSFSNPGTPYDNAVAEAHFSMIKRESLAHKWYSNIEELKIDVEEYIDFFNNFRPLKKFRNLPPSEFEKEYFDKLNSKEEETVDIRNPF